MPINPAFMTVLAADADARRGLFATTARRTGASERNAEKDFWVCLTLDVLFNGLEPGGPRLLFKGGTSLSKAYGLIARFSEDIDVTVFRDDLGQAGSIEQLAALSGKRRSARLDAISDACRAYINGPLLAQLTAAFGAVIAEAGHEAVEIVPDPEDPTGQGLQVRYASVTADGDGYIRPIVRIESGAKSALDPNAPRVLRPYVEADLPDTDFAIPNVVTVDPRRTFWDKVVILHGLRRWYDIRRELRQEGQRISRHYYDLYRLLDSEVGDAAGNLELADDCVRHARMFFNRPDFDLATARPGTFALAQTGDMVDRLHRDYAAMAVMIFGDAPPFDEVLAAVAALEQRLNG
jgi:nucleotidyltransferase AbiEii toxin of type IV toxin-antitoxin system